MKTKIDCTTTTSPKMTLSKRATKGNLSVEKNEKTKCPYCHHNKKFIGNSMGLMIDKCTRCKRQY